MDQSHNRDGEPLSYWSVQPLWVRLLTILIALPAWLALAWLVLSQNLNATYIKGIIGVLVLVAIAQISFIARAYLRNEM